MPYLTDTQAPPLTDRDTRLRDDPEWLAAVTAYLALRAEWEGLGTRYDEGKPALVALSTHAEEQGGGVAVTRFWKKGSVECKRVPELADVDLEQFRGAGREEVRVTTG